jgi:hypothetical protein
MIRNPKQGGILLPATGYIQVYAYSSYARLPLQDVAVTVTAPDGTALALQLTDRSGKIAPIPVPVPDKAASQTPDTGEVPFVAVNLQARLRGYEQIFIKGLQIFADTTTDQDLEMIPLSELPAQWDRSETFDTPPQNL